MEPSGPTDPGSAGNDRRARGRRRPMLAALLAAAVAVSGCDAVFADPCGIGTRLEGEPTPDPACGE